MPLLTQAQQDAFWTDGCVTVENALTPEELSACRAQFSAWVEESRAETSAYGAMIDGRPRFDMDPSHTNEHPALRRVSSPTEVSDAFLTVVRNSRVPQMCGELFDRPIRFHHGKLNSKLPKTPTVVEWHQDFAFTPHSNDDQITALMFLDDVTDENGPLRVARGSHKGPIHSHWRDDRFVGAVDAEVSAAAERDVVYAKGPAGSVCLMHVRALHASTANNSNAPRTLFICNFAAADAAALSPNPVPSEHMGMMVVGDDPNAVRATPFEMRMPEYPKGASFFVQQSDSESAS